MGPFRNIDILYMETIQKDWEDSIEREINRKPIMFPVSLDRIEIDEIESFGEKFSPSPSIKRSEKDNSREVNIKKKKNKCKSLL